MADETRKTTIYLIRHGEPAEEFLDRFYGQMDVPLSDRGRSQSRATAERLAGIRFDAVYSSDLQRATYMADVLAEPLGLPVRQLAVFRERDMGLLQGMTLDEMRENHPELHQGFLANRALFAAPGGENFERLRDRVVPAALELAASFPGGRVALAAHAGPIRVVLAHALGMPLANVFQIALDHACVSVVELPEAGAPRVKLVNG